MEQDMQLWDKLLKQYEEPLTSRRTGDIMERVDHILRSYKSIADNALNEARGYLEETKTLFKALEIVLEGLTADGMNHGQKRVIANHLISLLRSMGDKLDQAKYEYNLSLLDRYNFWRTNTPERRLYEERADLKRTVEIQENQLKYIKDKYPEVYERLAGDLPF